MRALNLIWIITFALFFPREIAGAASYDVPTRPGYTGAYNYYSEFLARPVPIKIWSGPTPDVVGMYTIQHLRSSLFSPFGNNHSEIIISNKNNLLFRSDYIADAPDLPLEEAIHEVRSRFEGYNGQTSKRLVNFLPLTAAQAEELTVRISRLGNARGIGYVNPDALTFEEFVSTFEDPLMHRNCHQYSTFVNSLALAVKEPRIMPTRLGLEFAVRKGYAEAGGARGLAIGGAFGLAKGAADDLKIDSRIQTGGFLGAGATGAYLTGGKAGLARFGAVAIPVIATNYALNAAGTTPGMAELGGIYSGGAAASAFAGPAGTIAFGAQTLAFKGSEGAYWVGSGFYNGGLENFRSLYEEGYNPFSFYFGR